MTRSGAGDPVCTVVMAAYNAAATITASIASVLAQTRPDFELIVIDDGSSDETAARVSEFASDRRVRLHRQANAGPASARNAGIGLARGRYVSVLDSDDLWLPDYLELMVGALESAPDAAFAYTRSWVRDVSRDRIRRETWPVRLPHIPPGDGAALLRALVVENFVNSSVTVRRNVLEHVGGYDPWVGVSEDYELWLRIAAAGYGATQVDGPLLIRSDRSGSLTKNDAEMCAGKKRAYERLLTQSPLSPEMRALAELELAKLENRHRLLAGQRRPSPNEYLRRMGALATRPVRHRSRQRAVPPREVARSFPGLGTGGRDGGGGEGAASRRRRPATRRRRAAKTQD